MMPIHAVVPVKGLEGAKSRLSDALNPDERRALVIEMLGRVLAALRGCSGSILAEVWVISADSTVRAMAERRGARTLVDAAVELNASLEQARTAIIAAGAAAMLIVPADVPLITVEDVTALARILSAGADVVLATDRSGNGTNALGLRLPSNVKFRFGTRSARLHLDEAATNGLLAQIYRSPTLALDIDDPESLLFYRSERSRLTSRVNAAPESRYR